ncbi:TIGR04283 family arsenosugar biosynthesis glycosyltransferase [uncultured Algibacter sp.]|uniref:TIGR04283 family arsenosugar biosynthesis glycosyltransferase n=1 Tax=uncultured Algibacter sp. TaxID=298659 RepID=UPI0032168423
MISIIIPVLNEEASIAKLLEHLLINSSPKYVSEIILIDGGSTDDTQNIIKNYVAVNNAENVETLFYQNLETKRAVSNTDVNLKTNITLLHSKKGRAKQMNLGAKSASSEILYFLHADSFPPKNFDKLIINEVKKNNKAGCFRMQFDSNHWWLRLASWLTQFSWRACRGGDQSQFITKTLFNDIGGFDERFFIYEDNILINALYARKQFVVINKKLQTSARLYRKHGVWKLQYHFWTIYVKKWFGATAEELLAYYKKNIY